MKILIVDDSKAMRMIVKRCLRQAGFSGHEVIEAGDGVAAIAQIKSASPDIVLSDWNMPEMNGYELLQNVKAKGFDVKFGFVTSECTDEFKKMASDAGALFFITKPITPEALEKQLVPLGL